MKNRKFYELFIVACLLSGFIYWCYGKPGIVVSGLDHLYFQCLVMFPFFMPILYIFVTRGNKKEC